MNLRRKNIFISDAVRFFSVIRLYAIEITNLWRQRLFISISLSIMEFYKQRFVYILSMEILIFPYSSNYIASMTKERRYLLIQILILLIVILLIILIWKYFNRRIESIKEHVIGVVCSVLYT